eukprot:TRINITY_DN10065_c0_g1_i1.p1 TRINITY_DN10065_c0_g1~~TRINITY_DN10065_c0_g1_i1.p1  ORF type:complete len:245 (+),score=25.80 TRINITY_DN10065_c0_g1_i1:81-815(+)
MASLIAFCLFAHLLYSASAFSFPWFQSESLVQEKRVESGRSALAALTLRAESNKCFHGAVEQLSSGCRELSEDDRRRLSVKLASCHVEKSGLPTFECTPDMSVEECTRPMTSVDIAFNAYSMFFLQVDSICYALQAERFQARTESLVSELVQNSVSAVESLGTLQTQSVDVADAMNRSLAAHDRLQYQQVCIRSTLFPAARVRSWHHTHTPRSKHARTHLRRPDTLDRRQRVYRSLVASALTGG